MINLHPLPRADAARARHLILPPSQEEFVGNINDMIDTATATQDFHIAKRGAEVVAFFKIDHRFQDRITWLPEEAAGLRGLLVGGQYQGQGIGRALLRRLPGHLKSNYPEMREVWLSVDQSNTVATVAYAQAGWVKEPQPFAGRCGPEWVMRLGL